MKKALIIFGCFILVIVFFSVLGAGREDKNKKEKIEEKITPPTFHLFGETYSGEWKDEQNEDFIKIAKTLVAHNITGCGEMYYAEASKDEYVVACTRDGVNFNYYDVWPRINKAGKLKEGSNDFYVLKQPWEGRKKVEIKTN